MITRFSGNRLIFILDGTETRTKIPLTLPDGYSIAEMLISNTGEIILLDGSSTAPSSFPNNTVIKFPIVDSMSPNHFNLLITNPTKGKSLTINIFKFGGIPNPHYTEDENGDEIEYNMIPSTQFER